ncbi:hypothetical protein [Actinophytocola oryzae]|uniref:DUF4352 domain-containing protein n=1 Tax=Actinophytocola oryzae TaxID=502181 RepID=A0A4R7V2R6_9PSEU|nr:hypothetical protein [Actinophytocola oryzae]TDV43140.1 hypothetical protein CLV71_11674 [Actinophytocola oryzae]
MSHRKIVIVACAAVLALAGCGSEQEETAAPGTSVPQTPVAASSSPSKEAPPSGDGELTPTGTKLAVGETATVMYETKSLSKDGTKLAVTTESVKAGSIGDLADFDLDAQAKVSDPFYVTVSFTNVGPLPMEPGGIFGVIAAHNTSGDELNRLSLIGDFAPCQGDVPDNLAVGESYTDCGVYLAPTGQKIKDVTLAFYFGDADRTEITWTA